MLRLRNFEIRISKKTFQIICSIIGILGITLIMTSNTKPPISIIAIIFCILLIVFAYVSTGKFGRFFMGEEDNPGQGGRFGRG